MSFNVTADVNAAIRDLTQVAPKQVRYATALAITRTAQDLKKAEEKLIDKQIDNPVNYTRKSLYLRRATKSRLEATVFFKDAQARYMTYQVEGGQRSSSGKNITVPVNTKLNKYGNIPGLRNWSKLNKLESKKNHFIGEINGTKGVWKRLPRRKGLQLVIKFEDSVKYTKRLDFYKLAENFTRKKFPIHFERAAKHALETAR